MKDNEITDVYFHFMIKLYVYLKKTLVALQSGDLKP